VGGVLGRADRRIPCGDDDRHLLPHQVSREGHQTLGRAPCIALLENEMVAFDIPEVPQVL
jgi:hypothetical protein